MTSYQAKVPRLIAEYFAKHHPDVTEHPVITAEFSYHWSQTGWKDTHYSKRVNVSWLRKLYAKDITWVRVSAGGYSPEFAIGDVLHREREPETVKGKDIQPGQVVKIYGRWLRVVEWEEDGWQGKHHDMRFALAVRHDLDPRLARADRGMTRLVWRDKDYPTREEKAPSWDWVTLKLKRQEDR